MIAPFILEFGDAGVDAPWRKMLPEADRRRFLHHLAQRETAKLKGAEASSIARYVKRWGAPAESRR